MPRIVPNWTQSIVIGRHAFADQYAATDFVVPGAGTLSITFTPAGGGEPITRKVYEFPGGGVAMGMYNPTTRSAVLPAPASTSPCSAAGRSICGPRTRS